MHTHTHTHTHIRMHAHTHTHNNAHIHMHAHTHCKNTTQTNDPLQQNMFSNSMLAVTKAPETQRKEMGNQPHAQQTSCTAATSITDAVQLVPRH